MAGLYAPPPTLRRRPRGRLRTDRGRRGLLLLHRRGLSPHTPCQSPGALTRVTARRIAQPPKAAFVTRLRSSRLPDQTARQLPEQSTIPWIDPSSTGDTRHRGALRKSRISHHVGGVLLLRSDATPINRDKFSNWCFKCSTPVSAVSPLLHA